MKWQIIAVTALLAANLTGCAGSRSRAQSHSYGPVDSRSAQAPSAVSAVRLLPDEFDRPLTTMSQSSPTESMTTTSGTGSDRASMHHHGEQAPGGPRQASSPKSSVRFNTNTVPTDVASKAVFVCPMHPEVTDSVASKCPKCGMTMVRRKDPK